MVRLRPWSLAARRPAAVSFSFKVLLPSQLARRRFHERVCFAWSKPDTRASPFRPIVRPEAIAGKCGAGGARWTPGQRRGSYD